MSSVDVVVPCYNYARFLGRCVSSILDQDGVDVRILIIDDASSDGTPAVGRSLAESDPRVSFRRHAKNQGHIATYNEGLLEWATSRYSLLISADDALAPGALARATQLMDGRPEIGMCYGMAAIIYDDADPSPQQARVTTEVRVVPSAEFLARSMDAGNLVPTPTAVVRTALQQQLGGYNPALPHSGDFEMWMRFAANGPIGVVNAVQAFYRMHGSSMSTRYYAQLLSDRMEVLHACDAVLERWGARFPQAEDWRRRVRRRLAEDAFWTASAAFEEDDADKLQACLSFAETVCPDVTRSGSWQRLKLKRLIGHRLWSGVGPVIDRLRRGKRAQVAAPPAAPVARTESGWWPA